MDASIQTREQLQAVVGKLPGDRDLKVIRHIDDGAARWIACSPLLFASLSTGAAQAVTMAGGDAGFAQVLNSQHVQIPLNSLDEPASAQAGAAFGSLFLVPGLRETLRINGRIARIDNGAAVVQVDECYMHCAKALIRSQFWQSMAPLDTAPDVSTLLRTSRFLALATCDADGHADLSPKGDPAGLMVHCDGQQLVFADRPGNRRTDSFNNLLERPQLALLALAPGSRWAVRVQGRATLSSDESLRAAFAVDGKTPQLVVALPQPDLTLIDSPALQRTAPWVERAPPADIDPAALFTAHVKASRSAGVGSLVVKAMVSVPGLMRKGLERDYKTHLY